jgi:hypothetical protein
MAGIRVLSYICDGRVGDRTPESSENAVRVIEEGVDVVVGQGTGMDGGPWYLGSDEVLSPRPKDIGPLIVAAKRTNTPFIFSMGGHAGADVHLQPYLDAVEGIARDAGIKLKIAKISGEVDPEYVKARIRDGVQIGREMETPRLSEFLSVEDVDNSVRIQAQMGPEPIMKALESEPDIDGVITGRALDVGIMMALPLVRGVKRDIAAHVGKIIECASMIAEPTNAWEAMLAEIEEDSFMVRPANEKYRCTVRSVSAHSLYERENPFEERNPGGVLDVGSASYEQVDDRTVRASGGIWRDVPYTVKIEGAQQIGFQSTVIGGLRDPRSVEHADILMDAARNAIAEVSGHDEDVSVAFHVYGRDAVLGDSDPFVDRPLPPELGIVMIVTAPTQELADSLATTGRLRLNLTDFPGRRSTASNFAQPHQRLDIPLGPAYVFNIWHLMPLDDPCEPFPYEIIEMG